MAPLTRSIALLSLSVSCAISTPKPVDQVAIPLGPLVAPEPIVVPVTPALPPPVPLVINPEASMPQPEAGVSPDAFPESEPGAQREPETKPAPERPGASRDPPAPPTSGPRPECIPRMTPHLGGDALHNRCADKVPQNDFHGFDALVNGKHFDALQLRARVLWEIKTDNFNVYTTDLRDIVVRRQAPELGRERDLAKACGFDFRVGVRSAAHKAALLNVDPTLKIVVMDWC